MEENLSNNAENIEDKSVIKTPEPINPTAERKKKFSIELILASISLCISLSTFGITTYQTHIMQNQQKAAVWAYLEAAVGVSSDGFYCDVHNKGVGAAIVKEVTYTCQGEKFTDFAELAKKIVKDSSFTYYNYSTKVLLV